MKKQLFALFISYLFGAFYLNAQSVDAETAKSVALHFLNQKSGKTLAAMRQVATPGASYYIFEPIDATGFVMVSSQRGTEPVLAYSLTQKFDIKGAPDNLKFWLDNYEQQIKVASTGRNRVEREIEEQWTNLLKGLSPTLRSNNEVTPLLKTYWDQNPLYNRLCPKNSAGQQAVTGCVATAMAQIMKYWNYPLQGQGGVASYKDSNYDNGIGGKFSANIGSARYNWAAMPNEVDETNWLPVAELMRDAGVSVEMDYGVDASSAYATDVVDAMEEYFGYNEGQILPRDFFDDEEWETIIKQSLDNGIPIYYFGTREDDGGKDHSHAWVCDGYSGRYFHMNWGWGGARQDIYFLLDMLNGKEHSPYHYDQGAIFGLTPRGCKANYFSTGAAVANVQVAYHIQANSTIAPLPGLRVVFDAGQGVTLLPGFSAPEGVSFTALIEGCGGNNAQGDPDEELSLTAPSTLELPDTKAAETNGTTKALSIAPNPFSGSTTVTYTLENEQLVSAQLLDVTGRLVASPISQQQQVAGEHRFTLEANNVPAGLYFLVLQTGAKRQTQRVVITK